MTTPTITILGAGISGLTLAWELSRLNFYVTVLEAHSHVGGLAGTVRDNGYAIDFGPHSFFTDNPLIQKVFSQLFPEKLPPLNRSAKFYYRGKYLNYPLNATDVLLKMGWKHSIKALLSFLYKRITTNPQNNGKDLQTVEAWAIHHFGTHLYQTFFKPYTEQFWKIPAEELSSRSIPTSTRASFFRTLRLMAARSGFSHNPDLMEREILPTFYPLTGYGEIGDRIVNKVVSNGGKIRLGACAQSITPLSSGGFEISFSENGHEHLIRSDLVVSTIPIPVLIRTLGKVFPADLARSAEKIQYRPLVVLGIRTSRPSILKDSMYVYYLNRPYNRIYEMTKFSPETCPHSKNLIGLEIPCGVNDAVWNQSKDELLDQCLPWLERDGILKPGEIESTQLVQNKFAYPIYLKDYEPHLQNLLGFFSTLPGLYLLGRTGEFKYMDADRCMFQAIQLAEKIRSKYANHNVPGIQEPVPL